MTSVLVVHVLCVCVTQLRHGQYIHWFAQRRAHMERDFYGTAQGEYNVDWLIHSY